jgi:Dullard-like phosphatase family protein
VLNRPLLILDLDETLVWAADEQRPAVFDFKAFRYFVTKRPHLDTFLDRVFEWFEVAVWTSSDDLYASQIVSEVFADGARLRFVWTRSKCTERFDEETREPYYLKNLKKLKRQGFDLRRVLILEDSPEKVHRHYGNLICVRPFEGQPNDQELLDILPFLDWLRNQPDIRRVEKRNWRTQRFS